MPERSTPYGAFRFTVEFDGAELVPFGGFADASGITTEVKVSEYRNGNDPENHVHKIPNVHTVGDVTLKRGVINSRDLFTWMDDVRHNRETAKKVLRISLLNEEGDFVQAWKLRGAMLMKYTAPTFAAKGGGDAAIEEAVVSAESLELDQGLS